MMGEIALSLLGNLGNLYAGLVHVSGTVLFNRELHKSIHGRFIKSVDSLSA